jgi:hypothetical protein
MAKRNQMAKTTKKPLDTFPAKAGRGRPVLMRASEIVGRAQHYRMIFGQVWDRLWPLLSNADSEEAVTRAFQDGAQPYSQNFVPGLAALTLAVLREPRFPKRREPQINFLADSLAGVGVVTPRRSRDICAQWKAKEKQADRIIRYEFYVECSCSYKGRSQDHACPKCGASINFGSISTLSPFLAGIDVGSTHFE